MSLPKILVKKLRPDAFMPTRATPGSAGLDLYVVDDVEIPPGKVALVRTGLAVAIPPGFELQIRSRSGLALKNNVFVLNSPGTIDSDYRGEVCIILANFGQESFRVARGARVAQATPAAAPPMDLVEVESLDETSRGTGGFGSTGQ